MQTSSPRNGTLTPREALVVRLVDAGFARWRIAELVGVDQRSIRDTIAALCARFDCREADLPATVEETDPDFVI